LSVGFYMDVHVPRAITERLRLRGIGVMTAQEDGARRLADPELLDRAAALSRVLFTRDADLRPSTRRSKPAA
jgi:predicted nuclease of predicted toxin-antitoxin system